METGRTRTCIPKMKIENQIYHILILARANPAKFNETENDIINYKDRDTTTEQKEQCSQCEQSTLSKAS